jgi:hypothetical protein
MAKRAGDIGPAERQSLSTGPMDMPDRGGKRPNAQITSEMVKLSRTEIPVANFGNRPSMGQVQCTSEKVSLSRTSNDIYGQTSKTDPGGLKGFISRTRKSGKY